MKKYILLLVIAVVALTGCTVSKKDVAKDNINVDVKKSDQVIINSKGRDIASTVVTLDEGLADDKYELNKLAKNHDTIFYGKINKINESTIDPATGAISTMVNVTVTEVVKGEVKSQQTLDMPFQFGTVSVAQFEAATKQPINLVGANEKETKYVGAYQENYLMPEAGKEYLFYTDKSTNYSINSGNALMEVKGDKVINNVPVKHDNVEQFSKNKVKQESFTKEEVLKSVK